MNGLRASVIRRAGAGLRRTLLVLALLCAAAAMSGCAVRIPFLHRGPRPPRLPAPSAVTATPAATGAVENAAPSDRDASTAAAVAAFREFEHARRVAADSGDVAQDALLRALAHDANHAPSLALLSKLHFESGRHEEGVALLAGVLRDPAAFTARERARLLAGLALHQDALGNSAAAREALQLSREASSRDALAADVYVTLRGADPDSAAERAHELTRREPRSAAGQNNVGITLLRAGDVEGARKAFEAAIERDPSLSGPYYNLAILEKYYRYDDGEAARRFAQYWSRSQDDPDGLSAVFAEVVAQATPQKGGGR